MVDRQQGMPLLHLRQARQAHLGAVAGRHVELLQGLRAELELRRHLQHHAVLGGLGEDGRDQPLAEGVVEHAVDVGELHAEARGGVAVDVQVGLQALVLPVAGDVGELRQLLQPRHQLRHPLGEHVRVGVLQGELVLGAGDPVLDGQVLHRLHVQLDPGQVVEFGLQALDHFAGGDVALAVRLEVDQQAAGVEGRVAAVDADVGGQAGHRRVLQHHLGKGALALGHGLEGDRLRRFGDALDHPGVLHREEAPGHGQVEQRGQRQVAMATSRVSGWCRRTTRRALAYCAIRPSMTRPRRARSGPAGPRRCGAAAWR